MDKNNQIYHSDGEHEHHVHNHSTVQEARFIYRPALVMTTPNPYLNMDQVVETEHQEFHNEKTTIVHNHAHSHAHSHVHSHE